MPEVTLLSPRLFGQLGPYCIHRKTVFLPTGQIVESKQITRRANIVQVILFLTVSVDRSVFINEK